MKKLLIIAALLLSAVSASAQYFDFSSNRNRYELGLNLGQMAYNTQYARFGMGVNLLAWGVYLDFNTTEAQHKYDDRIGNYEWNDDEFFSFNLGYQFPVLSWLRVMPLLGYAQTNEGITYGDTLNVSGGESSSTLYHTYKVTPGSRVHRFNFGGGISVQPLKWFSINLAYTRHAIYGGIAFNFGALTSGQGE
ncbi:MAG: hypothetical protein K6F58_00165 [Bacteroidales bacterium]|nr:hypothetical protein [Bacteroidales bacterium]